MLRTTIATLACSALLVATSFANDCGCSGGGFAAPAWNGYCGCNDGGNTCCPGPAFPLLHCALHRVGRVVDALIPDPCCRRTRCCSVGCAAPTCAAPTCGVEPGCYAAPSHGSDPFIDDHGPPTPIPMKDARSRGHWNSPKMTSKPMPAARPVAAPKPAMKTALKPVPKAVAAAPKAAVKAAKPIVSHKALGKSVLKVAYESETVESEEELDAPPAIPTSIRDAQEEPATVMHVAAKPVFRAPVAKSNLPANPLR